MEQQNIHNILVAWRGKKILLEMNSGAYLKELGQELQKLTDVKADTLRLIVPSNKSSKLLSPFSDEHSCLSLQEIPLLEGKSIQMMGVPKGEVDEVLQNAKTDLRIAGFDEKEKRLSQRMLDRPHNSLKLPQGTYIFCDFRTLHIPGMEFNPPASKALKLMHTLAGDWGIVAIMNKHRWRVGIMTEMAPEGYVGISPKCILGFNKNHGEEISLRLRTDDLKGFRKYESIKKTLLHELAHMVYSEHDANFYALDKQLNQEAAMLDWTRSRSHTLSGVRHSQHRGEEFYVDNHSSLSQKLGGRASDQLTNARSSSVAAAYRRLASTSTILSTTSEVREEPDPDDSGVGIHHEPDHMNAEAKDLVNIVTTNEAQQKLDDEPDPDDSHGSQCKLEPDPDDSKGSEFMEFEPYAEYQESKIAWKPNPDDTDMTQFASPLATNGVLRTKACKEPDPVDSEVCMKDEIVVEPDLSGAMEILDRQVQSRKTLHEPDPDDSGAGLKNSDIVENQRQVSWACKEPIPDDSQAIGVMQTGSDPDDNKVSQQGISIIESDEPDPDDKELLRIQDPVTIVCGRLQKAIEMLRSEVNPLETASVLQTLFKIIRNVIEHPDEMKFKKLRKANPLIQRNVVNYKAAMEILFTIGFNEDVVLDEVGKAETYIVLKRNDPGLLWLAKSSLETCIA